MKYRCARARTHIGTKEEIFQLYKTNRPPFLTEVIIIKSCAHAQKEAEQNKKLLTR
jgi:hypothetical protein